MAITIEVKTYFVEFYTAAKRDVLIQRSSANSIIRHSLLGCGFRSENLGDSAAAREFRGPSVEDVSVTSNKSPGQHRRTEVVPRGHQFKRGVNHS
jgi:hypothetical protein